MWELLNAIYMMRNDPNNLEAFNAVETAMKRLEDRLKTIRPSDN